MKKNLTKIFAICMSSAVLLNTSCATIFGKSNYSVAVNSTPASTITITNRSGVDVFKGSTPATISLKSSNGYFSRAIYQIKFHSDGYQDKTVTVESKLNGWYIGNILIGGVIGMLIVDPLTGAMYKIDDLNVNTTLEKSTAANASTLEIIGIDALPKASLKNLVKIN